jgi:hypothetical protein
MGKFQAGRPLLGPLRAEEGPQPYRNPLSPSWTLSYSQPKHTIPMSFLT